MYPRHRINTTDTNDEALRNLDTRRDSGREGDVVLHVGGSSVATEGVYVIGDSPHISSRLLMMMACS